MTAPRTMKWPHIAPMARRQPEEAQRLAELRAEYRAYQQLCYLSSRGKPRLHALLAAQ